MVRSLVNLMPYLRWWLLVETQTSNSERDPVFNFPREHVGNGEHLPQAPEGSRPESDAWALKEAIAQNPCRRRGCEPPRRRSASTRNPGDPFLFCSRGFGMPPCTLLLDAQRIH